MSLYDKSSPEAIDSFRSVTQRQADAMPNVTRTPALEHCIRCLKRRTKSTGAMTPAGFVCGMCSK